MIIVTEIPKPADCRYMTISECIEANGNRHWLNYARYRADGKDRHALGSLRKAIRNYMQAGRLRG